MKDCRVLLLVIIAAVGVAQTPATFEVISVKPYITQSDPSQESSDSRVSPGGRFTGRNVSAMKLLRMAFVVEDSRISGVPGWCSSQSYDIEAKTAGGVGRRGNTVAFGHGYRPAGLTPNRWGDYEEPGPRYSAPSNGVPRVPQEPVACLSPNRRTLTPTPHSATPPAAPPAQPPQPPSRATPIGPDSPPDY